MEGLHYDDRLKFLNLMRLETRRVRSDLNETFKIVNGKYSMNSRVFFEYDEGGRRGHSKKLFKKRTRLDVKKISFSNKVVDKWNFLTDTCVNCITVNNFKDYFKRTRTGNLYY